MPTVSCCGISMNGKPSPSIFLTTPPPDALGWVDCATVSWSTRHHRTGRSDRSVRALDARVGPALVGALQEHELAVGHGRDVLQVDIRRSESSRRSLNLMLAFRERYGGTTRDRLWQPVIKKSGARGAITRRVARGDRSGDNWTAAWHVHGADPCFRERLHPTHLRAAPDLSTRKPSQSP